MSTITLQTAKKAYDEQDYPKVLTVLQELQAVSKSHGYIVALLDLRVSTFLKLNKPDNARSDARRMIRSNKADGRGYLRCGQLERLKDNHAGALTWYEHGLKNVPETDRLHAFITAQHTKTTVVLQRQLTLKRASDPLARLPAEIIEMILGFFSYYEATAMLRVSKGWKRVWSAYSSLRNTLDFTRVAKGRLVSFISMKAALRRSRLSDRPVDVLAANLTPAAARHLKDDMSRWTQYRKMQRFEIYHPLANHVDYEFLQWHQFRLKTVVFGLQHEISLKMVFRVLSACETLEKAHFAAVMSNGREPVLDRWADDTSVARPHLMSLTIQGGPPSSTSRPYLHVPNNFFKRFPRLQELACKNVMMVHMSQLHDILDLSSLNDLRSFDCSGSTLSDWPRLPVSIETINATDCWMNGSTPVFDPDQLPRLRVAKVSKCTNPFPVLFMSNLSALTRLDIDTDFSLFHDLLVSGRLSHLIFLGLKCQDLRDDDVPLFISGCPDLDILELKSAMYITGCFIIDLLKAPTCQLRRLVLNNCDSVSPDAIEYARQKGVNVERSTAETRGSGIRVRDAR